MSRINLALCYPHLDETQRHHLARQSLLESARNTFEIALFWRHPEQGLKRIVAVDGDAPSARLSWRVNQ